MSKELEALKEFASTRLRAQADSERAVSASKYMRNQFVFYGLSAAVVAQLVNDVTNQFDVDRRLAEGFVRYAWEQPQREYQYLAVKLLRRQRDLLLAADIKLVESMITNKSWWDTNDEIASQIVGPLVRRFPGLVTTMDSWIANDNMWLRRCAILHQLQYKETTDYMRLFAYCDKCSQEKDFFIRKGIGWALRQAGRTDPVRVREYVNEHEHDLSNLSKREALKHIRK